MRKISGASIAMTMAIALYFMLFWGFDALRALTSPTYGLEDVWRSQTVFGIGRFFSLSPIGLIQLAAFMGTLKLAAALICAVHIADRFLSLATGKPVSDVLEGGLILIVAISMASAGPALWSQNGELVREQALQLALAAVAIALCLVEHSYRRRIELSAVPQVNAAFTPWR